MAVCVKGKSTGTPSVSAECVETIRQSFVCSPHKFVRHISKELNIQKTTVWQILWKRLLLRPYRSQILQQLKPTDKVKWYDFCCNFLGKLADGDTIINKLVFSDEATFRVSGVCFMALLTQRTPSPARMPLFRTDECSSA
jgi:hypothetical protein